MQRLIVTSCNCRKLPLPPLAAGIPLVGDTLDFLNQGPYCGVKHHNKHGKIYRLVLLATAVHAASVQEQSQGRSVAERCLSAGPICWVSRLCMWEMQTRSGSFWPQSTSLLRQAPTNQDNPVKRMLPSKPSVNDEVECCTDSTSTHAEMGLSFALAMILAIPHSAGLLYLTRTMISTVTLNASKTRCDRPAHGRLR